MESGDNVMNKDFDVEEKEGKEEGREEGKKEGWKKGNPRF